MPVVGTRPARGALLAGIVLCATAVTAFADSLAELVGQDRAERLADAESSGEIHLEVQLRNPDFKLLHRRGELARLAGEVKDGLQPGILVESLVLYPKPTGNAGPLDEGRKADLFNILAGLGTLAGIQYFSASRGQMRTFYESSTVIDGPTGRNPLPDPHFTVAPESLTLYARQKDLIFRDNIYRYDYRTGEDFMLFVQENLTAMNVGILPAIGRNRLRTVMAVIDTEDAFLIYIATMSRAGAFPGIGDRIGSSLGNRIRAVMGWFVQATKGSLD